MTSECIYIGLIYLGLSRFHIVQFRSDRFSASIAVRLHSFLSIGTFLHASLIYIRLPLCIMVSRRLYNISRPCCWLAFSCYFLVLWLAVTASEKLVEEAFSFWKICDDWIERFACVSNCWKFWWCRFKYLWKNKYFCSTVQILIGIGTLFVFNKII